MAAVCADAVSRGLTSSQFPLAVCTNESPIIGAVRGALIAASVYGLGVFAILVLVGYGIRKARHRPLAATSPETTPAERRTEPPAVLVGPRGWFRPAPLLLAIGAALAWAVLSVGPSSLAEDIDQLVPRDTVTAALTTRTQPYVTPAWCPGVGIHYECLPGPSQLVVTEPYCASLGLMALGPSRSPEADGMCHDRSGGTVEPLINDLFRGGKSGLLAFLAVGAALLIWPRLRAASSRVDDGQPRVL